MLKEYILSQSAHPLRWSNSMPGVQICRFTLPNSVQKALRPVPVCGERQHFEVLFCLTGRLVVQPLQSAPYVMEAPGIFLLSHSSALRSCQCSENLSGILVEVNAPSAKKSLQAICSILGMHLDTRIVKQKMAERNGSTVLSGTPWTQAFFETLQELPAESQERYCVFKAVELLYLLCSGHPSAEKPKYSPDGYASPLMLEIKAYLLEHLSEKNTIQLLCRQFSVSPTFLKENFRRAFGSPIHSWLVEQRLKWARELICTTRMPIQQVAHTVGYEGMSQFNAAFKRCFGMTPGQYRKMSETATLRPF